MGAHRRAVHRGMGFGPTDTRPPCRWIALRHGLSKNGNDHIQSSSRLCVRTAPWRTSGTTARRLSVQQASLSVSTASSCLSPASSGAADAATAPPNAPALTGSGSRPSPRHARARRPRECSRRRLRGRLHPRLARRWCSCSASLRCRPCRRSNGLSVALPSAPGTAPIWYSGGQLARDLTLPRLRARGRTPQPPRPRPYKSGPSVSVAHPPPRLTHRLRRSRATQPPSNSRPCAPASVPSRPTTATHGRRSPRDCRRVRRLVTTHRADPRPARRHRRCPRALGPAARLSCPPAPCPASRSARRLSDPRRRRPRRSRHYVTGPTRSPAGESRQGPSRRPPRRRRSPARRRDRHRCPRPAGRRRHSSTSPRRSLTPTRSPPLASRRQHASPTFPLARPARPSPRSRPPPSLTRRRQSPAPTPDLGR